MASEHQTTEYRRNAKIIRSRVNTLHKAGDPVMCWRCRGAIVQGQPFDVGHVVRGGGSILGNLAPEHRHRTGSCQGNRADGGSIGARITNSRRSPQRQQGQVSTWKL